MLLRRIIKKDNSTINKIFVLILSLVIANVLIDIKLKFKKTYYATCLKHNLFLLQFKLSLALATIT